VVEHRNITKPSNRMFRIKERGEAIAASGDNAAFWGFYKANRKAYQEIEEYEWAIESRGLLEDLANLHDDDYERFKRRCGILKESPESLIQLRNELRSLWVSDSAEANRTLAEWLFRGGQTVKHRNTATFIGMPLWAPDVRTGRLLPDPLNLKVQLVTAVLAHFADCRKCENPACDNPYFLVVRNTQKYCQSGPCTEYAQRKYAKEWHHTPKGRKFAAARKKKAQVKKKAKLLLKKKKTSRERR
jgi:hypothetical protein